MNTLLIIFEECICFREKQKCVFTYLSASPVVQGLSLLSVILHALKREFFVFKF